jgi:CBS-domain-containing membrane protein
MPPKQNLRSKFPLTITAKDKLSEIMEYQKLIVRNQIVIVNLIGALTKEMTGKIPIISVEMQDIIGGISTIDVMPTIQDVKFHQEVPHSVVRRQE